MYPHCEAPSHDELDITDFSAVQDFIQHSKPDLLIHCAAMTGVVDCENNKEKAYAVNVTGTRNLLESCFRFSPEVYFVYISTPCIFSGFEGNYHEDSVPYPQNFYGLTKLLGECEVKNSRLKKWLIIRSNFVPRKPWPYPRAFVDRYGTYLFADTLAKRIREVVEDNILGVIHICGNKRLSMYELAKMTTPTIMPMTLDDYVGPHLTRDMTLISKRLQAFEFE